MKLKIKVYFNEFYDLLILLYDIVDICLEIINNV